MAQKSFQEIFQTQIDFQIHQAELWLNKFDREALTPITIPYLEKASQSDQTLSEIKELLDRAVVLSQRYENSLETPEVLVRGGVILFYKKDIDNAYSYLDAAIALYEQRGYRHRQAVAALIKGLLELAVSNRNAALSLWEDATRNLELCREQAARDPMRTYRDPFDEKVKWYTERLFELNINQVLLPEYVISWMNRYEPIPMDLEVKILQDKLFEVAANQDTESTRRLAEKLGDLAWRAEDPRVTSLIFANIGIALVVVKSYVQGLDFLRRAVVLSNRLSHQRAVMSWLKALIEWHLPDQRKEAVISSGQAVAEFGICAQRADHKDRQNRKDWYLSIQKVLLEASERLFKLFLTDLIG